METRLKQGKSKKVMIPVIAGIIALMVAGTVYAANEGLIFTGKATVDRVAAQLTGLDSKVESYEQNEQALLAKISNVRSTANERITAANELINTFRGNLITAGFENRRLSGRVTDLENQVTQLQASLATLKSSFDTIEGDNARLQLQLNAVTDALRLLTISKADLDKELAAKQTEVERLTLQLLAANKAVEDLGTTSDQVATNTNGDVPLTSTELNAVNTTLKAVQTGPGMPLPFPIPFPTPMPKPIPGPTPVPLAPDVIDIQQ